MKKLTYLLILCGCKLFSQSLSPQVINSAGGNGTVGTGTNAVQVYYNIGEPIITTINNSTNMLTQGFLQPDILGNIGLNVTPFISNESCLGKLDGKINLVINTKPTNTYVVKYFWTPATVCPSNTCEHLDSLAPGSYTVLMKAYSNTGVQLDSVVQSYTIAANPDPCQITVYSSFTPNGDNINDVWVIDNIENFPNNTVTIYNRWGGQIENIKGYNNTSNSWNGQKSSGSVVPNGTYFYVIELNNGTGYKKGWVEVMGK